MARTAETFRCTRSGNRADLSGGRREKAQDPRALRRYAPEILQGELQLAILPMRKDAVVHEQPKIFVAQSAIPDFGAADSIAELKAIEIVARYSAEVATD